MGFTVPRVDTILVPYAEKSFKKYKEEYMEIAVRFGISKHLQKDTDEYAEEYARNKVQRDFEQGWQGIEYKLNSVGSSRGDYPEQLGHSAVMC